MPEVRFRIRWPDGSEDLCYSPSTVVREHLATGDVHPLANFLAVSEAALLAASRRVEARYGAPCSRAVAQLKALQSKAALQPSGAVEILSMD
ncbi:MSMEG_0570 family nitrogen starvation response protein [Mesorhizobium loti]|uniref:MSMEG_0570 family nitrogen starvation response protein n=1 Tax=Mesorhizobium loti R88b TaxID=935548 RepID=A0A6M7WX65_RHILI|nr:MSMEG_0570 family nitrogen starvation response protein [Mesorhizobium loti]QKD04448.1 MSMEG_0570 family nitrogen starvation response protein [Mesorhizobium loti R88b]